MALRLSLTVGIIALALPSVAHADDEQSSAESAKLFTEASHAHDAKDFKGCAAKAAQAFAKFEHAQIRGLQGLCELELGQYREAATHLAFYVDQTTSGAEPAMKAGLALAKERVAQVIVRCDPSAAELTLDGTKVGKPPISIFLDPGPHTVSAQIDGYLPREEKRDIAAGTKIEISIRLSRDVVEKPRPIWPGAVGLGLAGGALVAGIATTVVSMGASSDAKSAHTKLGSGCSSKQPSSPCQSGFDSEKKADLFGNVAVGSFIAAGVLAAASIPYVVWAVGGHAPASSQARWTIVPVISPFTQGALLHTSF